MQQKIKDNKALLLCVVDFCSKENKDNRGMNASTEKISGRGGAGRGQGRKQLSQDGATVRQWLNLTPQQQAKLKTLGGPKWVRAQIDAASLPSGD